MGTHVNRRVAALAGLAAVGCTGLGDFRVETCEEAPEQSVAVADVVDHASASALGRDAVVAVLGDASGHLLAAVADATSMAARALELHAFGDDTQLACRTRSPAGGDIAKQCKLVEPSVASLDDVTVAAAVNRLGCGLGQLRVGVFLTDEFRLVLGSPEANNALDYGVYVQRGTACTAAIADGEAPGASAPSLALVRAAGQLFALVTWLGSGAPQQPPDAAQLAPERVPLGSLLLEVRRDPAATWLRTDDGAQPTEIGETFLTVAPALLGSRAAPGFFSAFAVEGGIALAFIPVSGEPVLRSAFVSAADVRALSLAQSDDGSLLAVSFRTGDAGALELVQWRVSEFGALSAAGEANVRAPVSANAGPWLGYLSHDVLDWSTHTNHAGWLALFGTHDGLYAARVLSDRPARVEPVVQLARGAPEMPFIVDQGGSAAYGFVGRDRDGGARLYLRSARCAGAAMD